MANRDLNIRLTAQDAVSAAFAKAEAAVNSLNNRVRTTAEGLSAFKVAAVAIGGALAGAAFAVYRFTQAAAEAEAIEAKLNATLVSTHGVAGMTKDALMNLANEMQRTTAFEGDVVLGAEALMLTFTKVNKDVFPTAIKLAADLSVGMGQDLQSSVIQVGKALNNPVAGVSALNRVGVQFTETQKQQIEKFMETNDVMSAQKMILDELATQFGGQAVAQAATFEGKLLQLKNAYGDLKEELGFIITKNTFFINGLGVLREYLERAAKWVNNNQLALMNMAKNGIVTVIEYTGKALEVLRFFHNGWLGIKAVANFVIIGIADALRILTETLALALQPFSKLIDGLVYLGALDSNPLQGAIDAARTAVDNFQQSSRDVFSAGLKEMEEVNFRYDRWGKRIDEITGKLRALTVQKSDAEAVGGGAVGDGGEVPETAAEKKAREAAEKARLAARDKLYGMGAAPEVLGANAVPEEFNEMERRQKQLQVIQDYHTKKMQLMVEAGESETALNAAYNDAKIQQDQQAAQMRMATASGTFGMMANMAQNLTVLTGKQGGIAFKAMKAFSIAQTLIKTYEGAVAARASLSAIPVVGPALGMAAFAAYMVSGLAQVKQIQSMEPGGSASGTTISGGGVVNPTYSGGAPTAYPPPTRVDERPRQDVTVIIQNGMGDADYWRHITENNIVPAINDAHDRDVTIKVRTV